ncbi:FecR family protein [Aestuariivivens insulae]|uniref:FecR family protein n=1 Tax=Aestuariivivens insulae TaxID=1621988 RepID=UPI001F5AC3F1|nr:FecR family protein [Aestuariivivens insulae]
MEPYSRYLEDDIFIDWVYHPTEDSDRYWQNYINDNPKEKEVILGLKALLLSLKTEPFVISEEEKKEILNQLLTRISTNEKKGGVYPLFNKYYKYAAMLLIFLTVGYFVNNGFKRSNNLPFNDINVVSLDSITNTRLTFATGENVFIEQEESRIEINDEGNVIVNQNDTISKQDKTNRVEEIELNTLVTPYGKRSKITLVDGTVVYLNAGTQFAFPKKFIGDKRTVYLSGEAFFEVAPNKQKPFIVQTIVEKLSIEVVGTKFNVSAYPSDKEVLTVLTEGKVNVVERNVLKNTKTSLMPGELAAWNKDEENVEVKVVNTDNYTLWIQGLLHFESESMVSVIKKIERFYNIDVDFEELTEDKINTRISGKLDLKEDIKTTLDNLMKTTELKYEKINESTYEIK